MNARVDQWLTNFEEKHRSAARLLFSGLDLVSENQVRNGLNETIERISASLAGPIVLLPVRELAKDSSYFDLGDQTVVPETLASRGEHGSEAIVANVVTGQLRRRGTSFLTNPTIETMRTAKMRTLLLISDFAGSGDQIVNFERNVSRHPTIAAWHSRKWIQMHAVIYAATKPAMARLREHFGEKRVHVHKTCRNFDDCGWSRDERTSVEQLCEKYGPRRRRRGRTKFGPYGYKNSQGMIAFAYSVPNNLPSILNTRGRPCHGQDWQLLFEGRAVPPELRSLFGDASPEERLRRSLKAARQQRLAKGNWAAVAGTEAWRVLLVLAALSRRPQRVDQVMSMTGLAATEVIDLARCLRSWGLVGKHLHLTDAGRKELQHAKGLRLIMQPQLLHANHEPYYPQRLRVGR